MDCEFAVEVRVTPISWVNGNSSISEHSLWTGSCHGDGFIYEILSHSAIGAGEIIRLKEPTGVLDLILE